MTRSSSIFAMISPACRTTRLPSGVSTISLPSRVNMVTSSSFSITLTEWAMFCRLVKHFFAACE